MWRTILSYTILYYSIPYYSMLYSTVLYWPTALLYWIALYFIVFYCNIQPMLYHSILSYTVLYVLPIAMLLCQIKLRWITAFYLTSSSWFVKNISDRTDVQIHSPSILFLSFLILILVLPSSFIHPFSHLCPSFFMSLSLDVHLLYVPVFPSSYIYPFIFISVSLLLSSHPVWLLFIYHKKMKISESVHKSFWQKKFIWLKTDIFINMFFVLLLVDDVRARQNCL